MRVYDLMFRRISLRYFDSSYSFVVSPSSAVNPKDKKGRSMKGLLQLESLLFRKNVQLNLIHLTHVRFA